jgi:hypothetical protein
MSLDLRHLHRVPSTLVLAPQVTVVSDPMGHVEAAASVVETLEGGGQRRCGWFESYLARGASLRPVQVSPVGRTPTYMGRTCCYQHMRDLEHRMNALPMPYETTCPECKRVFRIQWGVGAR